MLLKVSLEKEIPSSWQQNLQDSLLRLSTEHLVPSLGSETDKRINEMHLSHLSP